MDVLGDNTDVQQRIYYQTYQRGSNGLTRELYKCTSENIMLNIKEGISGS
jgi:hypothetical protein